jgi:hypothetical protein
MRRGNITALLALLTIILLVFSSCMVNEVKADTLGPTIINIGNSYGMIQIFSPQDITYNSSTILLNFTVRAGRGIYDVGYSIDNGTIQRVSNLTQILVESAPDMQAPPPHIVVTDLGNVTLSNLTKGNHTLTVYNGFQYDYNPRFEVIGSSTINFSINAPILKMNVTEVSSSESFTVSVVTSESYFWIGYSLDNQANATSNGNFTLTNLVTGSHNLTIYANDTAGNMGASNTVYFTVEQSRKVFSILIISLVLIVAVALLTVGALAIHKRKHTKEDFNKNKQSSSLQ